MSQRCVISLSGGMDSATLIAYAKEHEIEIAQAVGFTYGSKHNKYENQAAQDLASYYQVPYRLVDLSAAFAPMKSNLLLSGGDIPEGHYEAPTMAQTVVPCRNLVFLSILAGVAESMEADMVLLGIHSGDHAIYPDCRPAFYNSADKTVRWATDNAVRLEAPFLHGDKASILSYGMALGVPYNLTRTCYKDQAVACGKCGSCQERLMGFAAIGAEDPIAYESREILTSSL